MAPKDADRTRENLSALRQPAHLYFFASDDTWVFVDGFVEMLAVFVRPELLPNRG